MFETLGQPEVTLLLTLAILIAVLFWVSRDARRHGMNATVWVLLVLFFNLLGLFAYLIARGMKEGARQP